MTTEQQRQQAEERRIVAERQRNVAERKRNATEGERDAAAARHQNAEDRRNAMEDLRQVTEEMRDTREQMRGEEGATQHTALEQRIARVEAHLQRLDERFTHLEQHLLQPVETLHRATHAQEEKNKAHIAQARHTVEVSQQKILNTEQLLERAQDKTRRFQG